MCLLCDRQVGVLRTQQNVYFMDKKRLKVKKALAYKNMALYFSAYFLNFYFETIGNQKL